MPNVEAGSGMVPAVTLTILVVVLYWFPIRHWYLRWGATRSEIARVMAGDRFVDGPSYVTTLAITIDARPADVWPWLVQMGYRRGGLYSYDWLDRLFGYLDGPSADRILPAFQQLRAGDLIPMGRSSGFPVAAVTPPESLVLGTHGPQLSWSWEFGLFSLDEGRCRLVSRNRARVPAGIRWMLSMRVLELTAFIMTRRMLIGIKQRAETLARSRPITQRTAA